MSINAVKATLANGHWESQLAPDAWEIAGDPTRGVGIWQWTPGTKIAGLLEHAHGQDPDYNFQFQVNAMLNNEAGQYYTAYFTETWDEFKSSQADPSYLTIVFMKNFERPRDTPDRWNQHEPYGVYDGTTGEMIEAFNLDYGEGNGSGIPVQVFRWPFDGGVTINQGPFETGVDHNDTDAVDWGPMPADTQQAVVAPYDGYLTLPEPGWDGGGAMLFHSKYQVKFADGGVGYATTYMVHDEAPMPPGEYHRGEVIYHAGKAGMATGRHVHMEILRTSKEHPIFYYNMRADDNPFGIISGGVYSDSGKGVVQPEFGRNTKHSGPAGPYHTEQFWIDGGSVSPHNALNVTQEQKDSVVDIGWSVTFFPSDLQVTNYNDTNDGSESGGKPTEPDPEPPRKEDDDRIALLNDIYRGAPNPHPELFK